MAPHANLSQSALRPHTDQISLFVLFVISSTVVTSTVIIMSDVEVRIREIQATLADMTDDANVLSLRYKYGLNINQRIKEVFKELIYGKQWAK